MVVEFSGNALFGIWRSDSGFKFQCDYGALIGSGSGSGGLC